MKISIFDLHQLKTYKNVVILVKYNDKWHNTMLGGFIEDFEDYEFERIH